MLPINSNYAEAMWFHDLKLYYGNDDVHQPLTFDDEAGEVISRFPKMKYSYLKQTN